MLSSTWVTWSYLSCVYGCTLLPHPPAKSVCVCVRCTAEITVTVISHQSEAAEPHIDIPDCLPVCLFCKNRYVKRQSLPPRPLPLFFPRIVCLSRWRDKKKKKERSLVCVSSDEKEPACVEGSDISPFRQMRWRKKRSRGDEVHALNQR